MSGSDRTDLAHFMHQFMFLPGGRYIYYGGRGVKFYNNCFLFIGQEDTREEWGRLIHASSDALMSGGGIGIDYSVFRGEGTILKKTGGRASGPIPLAHSVNEYGRNVRQGGSRRSAIYGSLNHSHPDIWKWLMAKDWVNMLVPGGEGLTYFQLKMNDFDAHAPLDFTNISVNYDTKWLEGHRLTSVFLQNVEMAMRNGEPGFSFNFYDKENETGRNACCEVTTADDSDVCNLGSINMAAVPDIDTFKAVVERASEFLVCGTIRGEVPNEAIRATREKNRRLGLGLMGVHEWLLQRGYRYEMNDELRAWLSVYRDVSESAANSHCDRFFLNHPVGYRAIAPTGTIGILAGTTTGIEPIFAVAYKRRYIDGEVRKFTYAIDQGAETIIQASGIDPDKIETSVDLAMDPERRIAFQADVQEYVDHAISSTLNLPHWGSEYNNEDRIPDMARIIAHYAPRLRGLTFYPDGARGGQPLVPVSYTEAKANQGVVFEENSEQACKSGVCGI
jgi:ribonucleoside-diphosphate reductase alpha chain